MRATHQKLQPGPRVRPGAGKAGMQATRAKKWAAVKLQGVGGRREEEEGAEERGKPHQMMIYHQPRKARGRQARTKGEDMS